jgi:hypothetical protein
MARYRVMSWRGIPSQIEATDELGARATRLLPPFFQQEIDRVAMAEGIIESDAYLEGWNWSPEHEREGTADEVAEALREELAEAWEREHGRRWPTRST